MFNFGFDPEQFASLGSSFDEPDPFVEQNDYSGRTNLAEFHDTAYTAMQNNKDGYEYNRPNPFTGDINLQAYQGSYITPVVNELKEGGYTAFQQQEEGAITKEQVAQGIMDNMQGAYVADNPITQDFLDDPTFDATKLYMNTGGQSVFMHAMGLDPTVLREMEAKGKFVDVSGGRSKFGDYSMAWVENPKGPSGWDKALNNPVVNFAAAVSGLPAVLALSAAKAANGQALTTEDYASMALAGFAELGGADLLSEAVGAPDGLLSLGNTTAEGMSYIDAINLASVAVNSAEESTGEEEEELQTAIDIINNTNDTINQTGVTPDLPTVETTPVVPDIVQEPIVADEPDAGEIEQPTVPPVVEETVTESEEDQDGGGAEDGSTSTGADGETGGEAGGDTGASAPPAEPATTEPTTTEPTLTGGGTYEGQVLKDKNNPDGEERWDDRQSTLDEVLKEGGAILVGSSDESVWGESGNFKIVIGVWEYDIDWDKGTYEKVAIPTEDGVQDGPELNEEAPIDFTSLDDLFEDTTVDTGTGEGSSIETGEGTGAADGSAGGTGTGTGTGAVTGTDGTGASTGGSTGAGGSTGTGTNDGIDTGDGDVDTGTGDGTGTGTGDGTGDGTGSGDGSGDGSGSGVGIGSSGMLNPQRTTNDLFFKELFQMNTQARDTQQIVRAGQPLQTFQQRQQQLQPVNRPRLGMLTDPELLKRYPY